MGRASQLVESARLPACVHGINDGGRDIFSARDRRVNRRQTAQHSETDRARTVIGADHHRLLVRRVSLRSRRKSLLAGTLLGGIGAIVGAFLGYEVRRRLANNLHIKDFIIAVCEDLFAIGLAVFLTSR
ncbi:MAG TPA: hypothetical protein VKD89_12005 [Candidatus Udaeobacter sp.]|nr:hypothetical protein [Candidatus Udaeobacter sp.]